MRHRSVGLVTTMGALHKGHLSLIARSKEENEFTLCSIFVNPTQFNDPADLERYSRPIERDVEALCTAGCDALFLPEVSEMYPPEEEKQGVWHLEIAPLEEILEGAFSPGHYQGVSRGVQDRKSHPSGKDRTIRDEQECHRKS